MTEAGSPGCAAWGGVGGGPMTGRQALSLVLRSLAELQETQGVTPHRVYRHIAAKGDTRITPGRLQVTMERAVRDGVLVQQRGRYNLSQELPVPDQVWGSCGCGFGSGKSRRRRKSSSKRRSKRCSKRHSTRRRRSSSSRRRSSRRRKPLCGQRKSLYMRLMRVLFTRRRRCSKKRRDKKRKPYTWVRQHCRRNPHHSRYRRKGRR